MVRFIATNDYVSNKNIEEVQNYYEITNLPSVATAAMYSKDSSGNIAVALCEQVEASIVCTALTRTCLSINSFIDFIISFKMGCFRRGKPPFLSR